MRTPRHSRAAMTAAVGAAGIVHTRTGFWIEEAGGAAPAPPLDGDHTVDVLVVGGGYLGMWTAWQLLEHQPEVSVAVVDAEICGYGPSGRNGGMVLNVAPLVPEIRERDGDAAARALLAASNDAVRDIGAWCDEQGVDAWYRAAPHADVSTASSQDTGWDAAIAACTAIGEPDEIALVDAAGLADICRSSAFRTGALVHTAATVQPARLSLGLRARLQERGVALHEHSRVTALRAGPAGVVAETAGGRVRAGAAVLTMGGALLRVAPLRRRLSVASSHMVVTEPVPDVLEDLGWTGGEGITDRRTLLHYLRTTRDGRIALGWGGGRMGFGGRTGGRIEIDAECAAHARAALVRFFPALAGRAMTHAWGGPIDVSPTHLPFFGTLDGRVHYGVGFTGGGVGLSHLGGRILASLALDRRDDVTRLPLVEPAPKRFPPEPLRWVGGSVVRAALVRKDAAEDEGGRTDPVTELVTRVPKLLGMNLPR